MGDESLFGNPKVRDPKDTTIATLRAELARKEAALRYVLEDDGLIPRATSACRKVVREALSSPSQASVVVPTDDLKWLIFGRETAGPLHDEDKARVARLRSLLGGTPNV